jgi:hypothetical protein
VRERNLDEYDIHDEENETDHNSDAKKQLSDYELSNTYEPINENENEEVNSKPDDLKNNFQPLDENQDKNQESISQFEPKDEDRSLNEITKENSKKVDKKYTYKENRRIRTLRNKARIIQNIYDGKYGGKCSRCKRTITKLPAFDLHHPDGDLKMGEIKYDGNWEKVLIRLEKEKAMPLCRNCHLKKQSKFYNKYKDIILHKNNFESDLAGIDKKIYQYLYACNFEYKQAYQIKSWISKRIVISRLYNGRCIGCGENNLASLVFHHRDTRKKTFFKYDALRYTKIEKIEKKLIKDDAICLCGNCHRMIEAPYFENNHKEILGNRCSQEIKNIYQNLKSNIKNFRFPENILKQYPQIKTEKIEIGIKSPIYELQPEEQRIKKEIKTYKWQDVTNNWKLPSGQLLNPTKECSRENPLYKHEKWLKTIYYNEGWCLSDEKIARLTNSSQSTINLWRKRHQIKTKDYEKDRKNTKER